MILPRSFLLMTCWGEGTVGAEVVELGSTSVTILFSFGKSVWGRSCRILRASTGFESGYLDGEEAELFGEILNTCL